MNIIRMLVDAFNVLIGKYRALKNQIKDLLVQLGIKDTTIAGLEAQVDALTSQVETLTSQVPDAETLTMVQAALDAYNALLAEENTP